MGDAFVMGTEREETQQMSGEDGDAPQQDAASVSKCPCLLADAFFFLNPIYSPFQLYNCPSVLHLEQTKRTGVMESRRRNKKTSTATFRGA